MTRYCTYVCVHPLFDPDYAEVLVYLFWVPGRNCRLLVQMLVLPKSLNVNYGAHKTSFTVLASFTLLSLLHATSLSYVHWRSLPCLKNLSFQTPVTRTLIWCMWVALGGGVIFTALGSSTSFPSHGLFCKVPHQTWIPPPPPKMIKFFAVNRFWLPG